MKKTILIFAAAICCVLLWSCSGDISEQNVPLADEADTTVPDVKGEYVSPHGWRAVVHPFGLDDMRQAYAALQLTRSDIPNYELTPTHYHVRFRPVDDEQLYALTGDESVVVFPFPMDYPAQGDNDFIDPLQPVDAPPFQYAWVAVDYDFPADIPYDILEELFQPFEVFPAEISRSMMSLRAIDNPTVDPDDLDPPGGGSSGGASPYNVGTVRVWDDLLAAYIPVAGVKVKASGGFLSTVKATTDANGVFRMFNSDVGTNVKYTLVWETDDYDIRDGTTGQASNSYDVTACTFNIDIGGTNNTGKAQGYATIHRAAYRWCYGDILGMKRPLFTSKIKISYYKKYEPGVFMGDVWNYFPHIKLGSYYPDETTFRPSWSLYANTSHEIAHYAHSTRMGNVQYWQVSKNIYESWATFAEYVLTLQEYAERGATEDQMSTIHDEMDYQWWPYEDYSSTTFKNKLEYSSLFVDLWDDYNQSQDNTSDQTFPIDNVSGYTPAGLNNILLNSYGLVSLETSLKSNKPDGVTDEQIEELLQEYRDRWND